MGKFRSLDEFIQAGNFRTKGNSKNFICPVHKGGNENNPSLEIKLMANGNGVSIKCHACNAYYEDILHAVGLDKSDIYFDNSYSVTSAHKTPKDKKEPTKSLLKKESYLAKYDYCNLDGVVIHSVVRSPNKENGKKNVAQCKPDPSYPNDPNRVIWAVTDLARAKKTVLYNLRAVSAAIKDNTPIFVVEGEKDVNTLKKYGYVATTNAMGAGKWMEHYSDMLTGANVYICGDNDDPGRKHAQQVAKSLYGKAKNINIIDILAFIEIGSDVVDIADYKFPSGGDISDFIDYIEDEAPFDEKLYVTNAINALIENAKPYTPPVESIPNSTQATSWETEQAEYYSTPNNTPTNGYNSTPQHDEDEDELTPPRELLTSVNASTFPIDCFSETLRDYILYVSELTQTYPEMAAVGMLGVLSTCLQGVARIKAKKAGHYENLGLYIFVYADPSENKSAVVSEISRPIHEIESNHNKAFAIEIKRDKATSESYVKALEKIKGDKATEQAKTKPDESKLAGLDKRMTEILIEYEKHLKKAARRLTLLVGDDTTMEAFTQELAYMPGNRVAIITDEGGFFSVANGKYSGRVDIDTLKKGYTGSKIDGKRVSREFPEIDRPKISLLIYAQPSVLDTIMSNNAFIGEGFIDRFLFSQPRSNAPNAVHEDMDENPELYQRFYELCRLMLGMPVDDNRLLTLARDAHETYNKYYKSFGERIALDGDLYDMKGYVGKLRGGAVLRIAGLLQFSEMIEKFGRSFGDNPDDWIIKKEFIQKAIKVCDYFLEQATIAYNAANSPTNTLKVASFILERLKSKVDEGKVQRGETGRYEVRAWDIWHMVQSKRFKKTADIKPYLDLLVKYDYLKPINGKSQGGSVGGRNTNRFSLNPTYF